MSIYKITVCLSFLFFFISCSNQVKTMDSGEKATVHPKFLESVKTEKAVFAHQVTELTLTGKVEYDPEKVIHYIPLVHGVVERTYFSPGDKVQKGQPLLDIRSSELSALLSEMISLESELAVEQRNLQSSQGMYDDKMLSEKELLEAKARFRQVQVSCERAKNDLSLYRRKDGGIFSILAPMSGYIVDKQVASGSPVSSEGNPLFTVADLNKVWITVNVYAGDLLHVQAGTPVEITVLSYPGEVFAGKIDALSQVFDSEEKVLKARIIMSNEALKFKPEMAVVVRLKNRTDERLIAVPSAALIFDNNHYFVVVEESSGEFRIQPVELGGGHEQASYIRSGLAEGEKVVVRNQLLIYEELNK
ncbi:MAG: efflux RND transporter periplasmic adaptor subunit [Dysgonamonadaceae bacterium]|jgi:cobalt-zinc-cadmium efflux system membrane fusion protein|nr:efflux RND transporter periplasmic adaptor subunit [Dysgonamonadaceae bacterium]